MFIIYFDYLSPTVTFYYKGFLSHSSIVSGILSIVSFILIIIVAFYFSLDLIKRRNPTAFFFNSFVEDAGIFPLNSSSFFHFISLAVAENNYTDMGVDFQNFRIIGIEDYFANYLLNRNLSNYNHWIYGLCNNESDTQGISHLIQYNFYEKSACIRKYYDKTDKQYYDTWDTKFRWPVMAHGTFNSNSKFYAIILERCQEETIHLVLGENYHCKTDEQFKNSIGTTSGAHFFHIDHYVNALNYENPNTKFIYRIENSIQLNAYPINHLNFNPILVETHNGLIFDRKKENYAYCYDRNDVFTSDNNGNDVYTVYYLWLNNRQNYYERSYKRIQDIISEIGGIYQFITITAIFINRLYNNYIVLKDTENLLFSSIGTENNKIGKKKGILKEKINTNLKDKKKIKNQNDITNIKKNENNIYKNASQFISNNEDIKDKSDYQLDKTFNKMEDKGKITINTKNDKKTFWTYFLYKISFEKKCIYYKSLEKFRKKIISEEHLMRNHLNIYNLLKSTKKKRRNSYHLKDLINLV